MSVYLLLFPELHLHLLVARLVLADAVAGDEVVANISQLRVLLPRFFDQTEYETHQGHLKVSLSYRGTTLHNAL